MSDSGKLSPNNINCLADLMINTGLEINSTAQNFMGTSTGAGNYTKGTIITGTVLNKLVDSIHLAYPLIGQGSVSNDDPPVVTYGITQEQYDNLISIGQDSIPALGLSKPSTYSGSYTSQEAQYGFLRVLANQAYKEMNFKSSNYTDILGSFMMCEGFKNSQNRIISSVSNSSGYLDGIYSNMNDLTTADIAGVNLSTLYFGQDLIKTGRVIDLSRIDTFGSPSNLLFSLQKNNAISKALGLAMIASGLTSTEIGNILAKIETPTVEQNRKLYGAYCLIAGNDLFEITTPLNCQTENLDTLADLLNPRKLFPNSYLSLTVPQYNSSTMVTNSKTYYLIYTNGVTNSSLPPMYNYLNGIIPQDVGRAAVAFSFSMQQIKNIRKMDIEKFSQVVTHLETTTGLVTSTGTTPTDPAAASRIMSSIAHGSGTDGQYRTVDFFGAASGIPYDLSSIHMLVSNLYNSTLAGLYQQMFNLLSGSGPYDNLDSLITQANTVIGNIQNADTVRAGSLNTLWDNLGTQLSIEQDARSTALPLESQMYSDTSTLYGFIDSLNGYSQDTGPGQSAQVLEALSDLTSLGGNALVASMRENRNAKRLGLTGGVLDNDIEDSINEPVSNNLGIPIVSGDSTIPGSLAGSAAVGLIPQNLDIFNISSAVSPSVITPEQAVATIIACNCDCWDIQQ